MPPALRYAAATFLLAVVTGAALLWPAATAHIFWLYLTVIILCALLFDIGTSFYATAVSVLALTLIPWKLRDVPPAGSGWIEVLMFALVAIAVSALLESFHRTINRLHRANSELALSDQEKDLLLRESAHRSVNDLMRLTGLIALEQRASGGDPRVVEPLRRVADKVRVFARLQQRLLRSDKNAMVQMNEYIEDLCRDVHSSLSGLRDITIEAKSDLRPVQETDAVLVGLITNELVTNALKHAFPNDRPGTVRVSFECNGECVLSVEDDGVGVPAGASAKIGHQGQALVEALARQLRGSYELRPRDSGSGTLARVRFPGPACGSDETVNAA